VPDFSTQQLSHQQPFKPQLAQSFLVAMPEPVVSVLVSLQTTLVTLATLLALPQLVYQPQVL